MDGYLDPIGRLSRINIIFAGVGRMRCHEGDSFAIGHRSRRRSFAGRVGQQEPKPGWSERSVAAWIFSKWITDSSLVALKERSCRVPASCSLVIAVCACEGTDTTIVPKAAMTSDTRDIKVLICCPLPPR